LTYLTYVLLARWLGSAALGVYVEAFAWCLILSILVTVGLGAAAMKFVTQYVADEDHGALRAYISRSRQIIWVVSLVFSIGATLVIVAFDLMEDGPPRSTILLAIACIPVLAWLRFQSRFCHAMSWLGLSFIPFSLVRPALFLGFVVVAWYADWLHTEAHAMLLQLTVIALIGAVANLAMNSRIRREVVLAEPKYDVGLWLRTGFPLLLVTLFTQYYAEMNIATFGLHETAENVAVFGVAFRTSMLVAFGLFAVDAFNMPIVMRFFAKSELQQMQTVLRHAARVKFAGSIIAVGILALVGEPMMRMFGPEFVAGNGPLMVLVGGQVIRAGVGPVGALVGLTGHQNHCLIVYAVGSCSILILHAILVPWLGVLGGSYAAVFTVVLSDLWLRQIVLHRIGVNPSIFGASIQSR